MATLFSKVAAFARSPKGQQVIAQAGAKAKQIASDPRTRAKIDQGTARIRAEVGKRRGGPPGSTRPPGPDATPR